MSVTVGFCFHPITKLEQCRLCTSRSISFTPTECSDPQGEVLPDGPAEHWDASRGE